MSYYFWLGIDGEIADINAAIRQMMVTDRYTMGRRIEADGFITVHPDLKTIKSNQDVAWR